VMLYYLEARQRRSKRPDRRLVTRIG
jgi:hypothetical protein